MFMDDHSQCKFLYLLSAKSEVLTYFLQFKALVEKETGCQIKMIWSNNGGEYTSLDFQHYLTTEGITSQISTPYTLEQNGLSEQGNQMIVEKIRPMLRAAGMSNGFWAEAATTATYLGNISPHTALQNKTPMEIWTKKRPHLHGIHEFGTITYALVPKSQHKKLDNKSEKCILLGYAVSTKAYHLWCIRDCCIIISCDVIFNDGSYLQDAPNETLPPTNADDDGADNAPSEEVNPLEPDEPVHENNPQPEAPAPEAPDQAADIPAPAPVPPM